MMLIPYIEVKIPAGFPSPAADYYEKPLDLSEYLVHHPSSTYYIRVQGESMVRYGIFHGDLLIVDRSLTPRQGTSSWLHWMKSSRVSISRRKTAGLI